MATLKISGAVCTPNIIPSEIAEALIEDIQKTGLLDVVTFDGESTFEFNYNGLSSLRRNVNNFAFAEKVALLVRTAGENNVLLVGDVEVYEVESQTRQALSIDEGQVIVTRMSLTSKLLNKEATEVKANSRSYLSS